jgi:hypothetical protein
VLIHRLAVMVMDFPKPINVHVVHTAHGFPQQGKRGQSVYLAQQVIVVHIYRVHTLILVRLAITLRQEGALVPNAKPENIHLGKELVHIMERRAPLAQTAPLGSGGTMLHNFHQEKACSLVSPIVGPARLATSAMGGLILLCVLLGQFRRVVRHIVWGVVECNKLTEIGTDEYSTMSHHTTHL